jgi:hypothetical protein
MSVKRTSTAAVSALVATRVKTATRRATVRTGSSVERTTEPVLPAGSHARRVSVGQPNVPTVSTRRSAVSPTAPAARIVLASTAATQRTRRAPAPRVRCASAGSATFSTRRHGTCVSTRVARPMTPDFAVTIVRFAADSASALRIAHRLPARAPATDAKANARQYADRARLAPRTFTAGSATRAPCARAGRECAFRRTARTTLSGPRCAELQEPCAATNVRPARRNATASSAAQTRIAVRAAGPAGPEPIATAPDNAFPPLRTRPRRVAAARGTFRIFPTAKPVLSVPCKDTSP